MKTKLSSLGFRQSLESALAEKRSADSLVEVIGAEDIGKLPDQNFAEVLENITGIQITRTAGVGTGAGEVGFVISGSYTEQESVSFRPRVDRDNIASPPGANPAEFLGIQFLVQEQENFAYETLNLATTLQWAPSDELTLTFDAIINEQQRSQDSYRLQASGVSVFRNVSIPSAFETIDFGVGPGSFPAALIGTIEPDLSLDDDDPNLRFSSDTGSRVTDSQIF